MNYITQEQAHDMGAKGAPPSEDERLLFEAWMRGHCWALSAVWDGKSYRGTAEDGNYVCPRAMNIRQLWAAWRDRAALAQPAKPVELSDDDELLFIRLLETAEQEPHATPRLVLACRAVRMAAAAKERT